VTEEEESEAVTEGVFRWLDANRECVLHAIREAVEQQMRMVDCGWQVKRAASEWFNENGSQIRALIAERSRYR
jgi:hypothetical protein